MNAVVTIPEAKPTADTAALALISVIERAASNPDVNIDKMERLLQMQERILTKRAESAFNEAMSAAQADMGRISADATNPQTHSRYASYGHLDRALRPIYTRHGFALSFDEGEAPTDSVLVLCVVTHKAGFSRTYRKLMPADGKGAKGGDVMTKTHAAGAAMTYGMRYLLKGIFNVAIGEDDTDGNEAAEKSEKISTDQATVLRDLIRESKSQEASFLRTIKAKSIESIPAAAYVTVKSILEAKLNRVRA